MHKEDSKSGQDGRENSALDEDPILMGSMVGLSRIGEAVSNRRTLALAVFGLVVLAAWAYVVITPANYTATAVVLVDPRQKTVIQSTDVLPGIGTDSAAVESQVELMRAAAVSPPVLEKVGLFSDPEFNKKSRLAQILRLFDGTVNAEETTPDPAEELQRNRALSAFERKLWVRRRGLTYILDVSFTSENAQKAADIANYVAFAYLDREADRKEQATIQATDWLDERLVLLRAQVRESEKAVAEYKTKHNIVELGATDSGETLSKDRIDNLNEQISAARTAAAIQKARYDQATLSSNSSTDLENLPDVLNSELISNLVLAYTDLNRSKVQISERLGPRHPSYRSIESEINVVKQQIQDEIKRTIASINNEYDVARDALASLENELSVQMQRSAEMNRIAVQLGELERVASADRAILEQFLTRLKETTEQVSLRKPDAQVIARARVPVRPSDASPMLIMVMASGFGSVFAVGSALVANERSRFKNKNDADENA